ATTEGETHSPLPDIELSIAEFILPPAQLSKHRCSMAAGFPQAPMHPSDASVRMPERTSLAIQRLDERLAEAEH
ncbi:MAG: hypothetical protein JWR80_8584, partial [Bradyrhizobium sp.]|nr:hypothetical protein [Bradyrhizobium sp.]